MSTLSNSSMLGWSLPVVVAGCTRTKPSLAMSPSKTLATPSGTRISADTSATDVTSRQSLMMACLSELATSNWPSPDGVVDTRDSMASSTRERVRPPVIA
jgi:hypothetical protein